VSLGLLRKRGASSEREDAPKDLVPGKRTRGCFVLLIALLLALGSGEAVARSEQELTLALVLKTDQSTYVLDQAIRLTLTLMNPGKTDIILRFRSSQKANFVIRRGKEEIWRWSHGRMFAQVLTQIKLSPGEQREIQATWDQKDGKGRAVPAGTYEAVGLILSGDRRDPKVVSFKIAAQTEVDEDPTQ